MEAKGKNQFLTKVKTDVKQAFFSCGHEMSKESVEKMVDEIEEDLNHINASGKFEDYSEYIKRYADTFLHKNHYLIMTAARNLIQWYTYKNGDPNR